MRTCPSLGILIYGGEDSQTGQPEVFSPRAGGQQCGLAGLPPSGGVFCSSSCLQWSGGGWEPLGLPQGRRIHVVWGVEEGYLLLGGKLASGFTDSSLLLKHDGTFQASFNLNGKFG